MADSMHYSYPGATEYPQTFYVAQQPVQGQMALTPFARPEQPQRKRPKYTRSKTGCLTCRTKKVKCDEEKPDCSRCRSSQRECVWPDGVNSRKRHSSKRDSQSLSQSPSLEARPSTAGSSGISEASTPPARHLTPPKAEPLEFGLPPNMPRRTMSQDYVDAPRRVENNRGQQLMFDTSRGFAPLPSAHTPMVHHTADMSSQYAQSARVEWSMPVHAPLVHPLVPSRLVSQHEHYPIKSEDPSDWSSSSMFHQQHVDPIQPFFPSLQQSRAMDYMKFQY